MSEKRIHIRYGLAGHETEFLLTVDSGPYTSAELIPEGWEYAILSELGSGWNVLDRGHRIEILQPELESVKHADEVLRKLIPSIVGKQYLLSEDRGTLGKD